MLKEAHQNRYWSKRGLLVLLGILVRAFWVMHVVAQPQLTPGLKSLTDIQNIKTLRAQFNQDVGKIRLIMLVVPT